MKNRRLLIVVGLIGLVAVGAAGWYLVSPLFIDNAVDEAFPFELPDRETLDGMSDAEMKALEAEFVAAVPDKSTVAAMPPEEAAAVEALVQEAAAVMTDTEMAEEIPVAADEWIIAAQGNFVGADNFHQGSGTATIYQQGEQQVLRLEDFNVTNGPELHVVLSTSRDDIGQDYIDLGVLKGNVGNQNYDIPADIDLSQYQSVVIYCVPFQVVFATATLDP
ncbi:hypothetical protein MNBD_CHLOROFLEXI01-3378 [hydrothermal vent metagenome]|uniref:DM13 domain-containing protein n=1 Tax=hydrothermal vent metagenome TaxID=652676 RepID=A0A3B0VGP2_9ZZZZ